MCVSGLLLFLYFNSVTSCYLRTDSVRLQVTTAVTKNTVSSFVAMQTCANITNFQRNLLSPSTLKTTESGCYVMSVNFLPGYTALYIRSVRYDLKISTRLYNCRLISSVSHYVCVYIYKYIYM
jgi:hypothetical protein